MCKISCTNRGIIIVGKGLDFLIAILLRDYILAHMCNCSGKIIRVPSTRIAHVLLIILPKS